MKYSIVIPTYNHCDDLLKPCLESLFKYTNVADIELIVSANGCTDNTKSYLSDLEQKFTYLGLKDNFKIVWHDEPLGFSKACNVAIEVASSNLIVLLSNDTILLDQYKNQWLDLLATQFYVDKNCGISCVLKSFSEHANRHFAIFFCVMIHRKVFDNIGLLNTVYGVGGGEDIEFSIEAENAGFSIREAANIQWSAEKQTYVGNFPIYHLGEGTVHDANLVQNWKEIFENNLLKVAQKYNNSSKNLLWLKSQHDEIYKEVITENCYNVNTDIIKDKTVVDIGANIGVFSLHAANLAAKMVIAVEPVSSTFQQLIENIETSKFENVKAIKRLVSDTTGNYNKINIFDDSGHNSLYTTSNNFEIVETISLSDLLMNVDNVFLKIDCEGSEYDILLNTDMDTMAKVTNVVMEVHADMNPKYKGFEILEDKMKFFGFKLINKKEIYSWKVDNLGNKFDYKLLPIRVEMWERI